MPEERDIALLWDMREAARDVVRFVEGLSYEEFRADSMRRYAVERQLIVIGEAARHLSPAMKANHLEIPWNAIIGQRNVLVLGYGEVLVDRIWAVATVDINELITLLDKLIPSPPKMP